MKIINKTIEYLLYLFIFLLPFQTRLILKEVFIGEFKWHQATQVLYGTEILLWLIVLLRVFYLFKWYSIKMSSKIPSFPRRGWGGLPVVFLIWILVAWSLVSIFWSTNPDLSHYWWLKLMGGIVLFSIILIAKLDKQKIALAFLFSGLVQSSLAIWQFINQQVIGSKWLGIAPHVPSEISSSVVGTDGYRWLRAYGSFTHPNILGGFLVICFVFVLYLYFLYKPGLKKILASASLPIISAGIFFSFSRSAWLALALVCSLWFLIFIVKKKLKDIIRPIIYVSLVFIVLFSLYPSLVITRLSIDQPLEVKSVEQRVDSLIEAGDIIKDNLFIGVGIGNYTNYLQEASPNLPGWHYQPAHNLYLMVLTELGLIGFIVFSLLCFLAFLSALKKFKRSPLSLILLLVVCLLGLFDHYLWTSYVGTILFWLVIGLALEDFGLIGLIEKIIQKFLLELGYRTGRNFYSPDYLSLITTFKCNFRCKTCDIWKKENVNELDTEDWLRLSSKIKKELKSSTFVEINGGEALLQTDRVVLLVKSLKEYFTTVVLNTNGSTINSEVVSKLKEAGLNKIKLSLYSLNSETHNFLRGTDIAYDSARRAIDIISSSGIDLEVGVLITAQNILQVPQLVEYLGSLNNISIIIQPLDEVVESSASKNLSSNSLISHLWPSKENVVEFFDWLELNNKNIKNSPDNLLAIKNYYLDPKSALQYRCFAGQRNLVIYPNGDIAMCFKGGVIGNLKDGNINSILRGAISERNKIKHCNKYCRIIGCNFYRGITEYFKR